MRSTTATNIGKGRGLQDGDGVVSAESSAKGQNTHSISLSTQPGVGTPRAAWRVVPASAGDHALIHRFLVSVFHRPSAAEFQAQLEEPTYEPSERLLVKDGHQIIAHLRLMNREMRFGRLVLPVGLISDLATLPEYRGHGCARTLLDAAAKLLLRDGAVLGFVRTDQPKFYAQRGWSVYGRHCYSTASPREILSHLRMREAEQAGQQGSLLSPRTQKKYNIRLWRHVEQVALDRLYQENTCQAYGTLQRSDAYWRWLVGRGGNERIYVAIDGPDRLVLDEAMSPIVGYAATREGRIVEIMCSDAHPQAAIQLLARACGDAIERDFHRVRLDAPPGHSLHQLLVDSGGAYAHHEADQGMVFMANLFKPRRLLKLLTRDMSERAKSAGLPRPCQLGLLVNNEKHRLSVSRRNVELVAGMLGRSYLKCSLHEVNQLLLGHLDVRESVESGRLAVSTRVALEMADALFPRLPFWRPPWDDLPTM